MVSADHRSDRLRRAADEALAGYQELPSWKRQVLARFLVERPKGWTTFIRSGIAVERSGGVDALVIGPRGVLAVLLREEAPADTAKIYRRIGELFLGARVRGGNLAEAVVRPVLVVPPERRDSRSTGDHLTVSAADLDRLLERGERRLDKRDARVLAEHLEKSTRDYRLHAFTEERAEVENEELFGAVELTRGRFDQALAGPFESWLTFLDDSQFAMVRRNYNGPARISGPAGTGKSVVAMHRLVHLAKRTTGPLLFSTYARTLPPVMRNNFTRLAPELARRVEFSTLYSWAGQFLRDRGRSVHVNTSQAETSFSHAWKRVGRPGRLNDLNPNPQYWREEIERVIKGRGLVDQREYQGVERPGRGLPLSRGRDRELVWKLYECYEEIREEKGVHDFNDLMGMALEEVRTTPLDPQYAAVVVDEVQDITLIGLRLLHALAGSGPNGLLLVGDGQQQIYAGGWRLSEAGIPIRGRGEVLRTNYRNASRILEVANKFEATNQVDDLDGETGVSLREVTATLRGGTTTAWKGARAEHEAALVEAVRELSDHKLDDLAVLTFDKKEAERWREVLRRAGFPVRSLRGFDGEPDGKIKVDTVYQAKGLEYRAVFIPELPPLDGDRGPDWYERGQRARTVAVTRARDHVWIGHPEG